MQLVHSEHWQRKKQYRRDITDDIMEYAVQHGSLLRDKQWDDALNAICKIPPSGRLLKVVYRRIGGCIKIITAFWLD